MSCLESPCPNYAAAAAGSTFAGLVTHLMAAQCLLYEDWPEDASDQIQDGDKFDFIIVGSGTAGSIMANRLAQVEQWKVLLIEAGGDPPMESIIPNFSGSTHRSPHVFQFYTEKDNTTNRGCLAGRSFWPRGRVLGGTGSINGLLHMRGSAGDYEPWHLEEGDGWDWPTIKQYFKKSEKIVDPFILNNPQLLEEHGTEGEFIIDLLNTTHTEFVDKLTKAYTEMGLKYLNDLNGETQMGVGKIRGGNHKGKRVSTASAFLTPLTYKDNFYILKKSFVSKVLLSNNKKAKGVRVINRYGDGIKLYVNKEVIVSAGTIGSPVLLMNSGLGPKDNLEEVGIKVVADLPIGQNLQDHVRIPIPVTIDTGSKSRDETFWLKAAAEYLLEQTGPHTTNYDQPNINAFLSVQEGQKLPDVQIDHNYFLPNTSYVKSMCKDILSFNREICEQFSSFNKEKELLIFYVSLCRPHSRGEILLRTRNVVDHPKIYSKYFSDERDLDIFIKALKRVMEIIDTPTFKGMKPQLERIYFKDCDDTAFMSDEYWECMARTVTYNVYHPVGTVKMGQKSDPTSVVDNKLRVFGVSSLRVVDASVMPTIPSVNTNAATMMIAERAADFIKMDYGVLKKTNKDEL